MLEPKLPAVADRLRQAREEINAFADFPEAHRRKAWRGVIDTQHARTA